MPPMAESAANVFEPPSSAGPIDPAEATETPSAVEQDATTTSNDPDPRPSTSNPTQDSSAATGSSTQTGQPAQPVRGPLEPLKMFFVISQYARLGEVERNLDILGTYLSYDDAERNLRRALQRVGFQQRRTRIVRALGWHPQFIQLDEVVLVEGESFAPQYEVLVYIFETRLFDGQGRIVQF